MSESGFSKEQQAATVPFFLHENEMTRMERVNKRLWIAMLVIFVALIGTNAGWIMYESQFQDEVYSYELSQDSGDGGENLYTNNRVIIGGDYNGQTDDQDNGQAAGAENSPDAKDVPDL